MPSAKKPAGAGGGTKKAAGRAAGAKRPVRRAAASKPAAARGAAAPVETAHGVAGEAPERRSAGPSARKYAGPTITIEQYGSGICCPKRQKRVLRSLGLRHPRQRVVRPDNPAVRGMVNTIPHLVRIVEGVRGA
jgi:large subunit ribosomal protein L30